jgi:PEP-CTERM motif
LDRGKHDEAETTLPILKETKMRRVLTAALFALVGAAQPASAVFIDFDNLAPGNQNGNVLAASGVTFATGNIPNAIAAPFTFSNFDPNFSIFASSAVSLPNIAVALGGGLNDVLMSFSTPITAISVNSDSALGEAADVIRLIAVAPTGNPNEFQVIAVIEASDNATTSPGNLLSLAGLPPFSFAIFQTTTEQEGFDNLNFTFASVPEPGSYALLALGLVALGMMRRRRGSKRASC